MFGDVYSNAFKIKQIFIIQPHTLFCQNMMWRYMRYFGDLFPEITLNVV